MIQQPLDMGWHGWRLWYMAASGMEPSLISVVLDIDLLTLGCHETVATSDGVWCSHFLS